MLIAVGILIVLIAILVSTVRGCQRNKVENAYRDYFTASNAIAKESAAQGKSLRTILENKDLQKRQQILAQITDLGAKAQGLVDRAEKLDPPDRVNAAHKTFITAMEYRALGLGQLPAAIDSAYLSTSKDPQNAAATVASPLQVLTASDVIYRTSFVGPAQDAIQKDEIKNIQVAESEMFPGDNVEVASPSGAAKVLEKLRQRNTTTTTPGDGQAATGKHGLGIVTVFAVSGADRRQLIPGQTVALVASPDLKFEVTIENSGDFNEVNVDVNLTYIRPDVAGKEQTQPIDSIDPGEANRKIMTFPFQGNPHLTLPSTVRVEVVPVSGEKNTANNKFDYPVEFNLS